MGMKAESARTYFRSAIEPVNLTLHCLMPAGLPDFEPLVYQSPGNSRYGTRAAYSR
jgi:hypothetical protein